MAAHFRSIFARQPLHLNIKQRRFFAAAGMAFDTATLSYSRLYAECSRWHDHKEKGEDPRQGTGMFADAWSVVDNMRRLQRLLWKFPDISHDRQVKDFVDRWRILRQIRSVMQHLEQDLYRDTVNGNYVYGTLTWIDSRYRESDRKVYQYVLTLGPQLNAKLAPVTLPTSASIDSHNNINQISIEAGGHWIDLSALIDDSKRLIQYIDDNATKNVHAKLAELIASDPSKAASYMKLAKANEWYCLTLHVPEFSDR